MRPETRKPRMMSARQSLEKARQRGKTLGEVPARILTPVNRQFKFHRSCLSCDLNREHRRDSQSAGKVGQ